MTDHAFAHVGFSSIISCRSGSCGWYIDSEAIREIQELTRDYERRLAGGGFQEDQEGGRRVLRIGSGGDAEKAV